MYLLVASPLGLACAVGFVTGTAVSVGLLVTWVGRPILPATLAAATAAAEVEPRLARRLVGVDATVPAFLRTFEVSNGLALPGRGFVDAVRELVTAPSAWTAVDSPCTSSSPGSWRSSPEPPSGRSPRDCSPLRSSTATRPGPCPASVRTASDR